MIGFLNVNKPSGISSSKVVTIVKKQFNISKVGHMGTLDPLAEGVLPIAVGKAARMFDYFIEKQKTYIAEFTFGKTTDTLDSEGEIVEECDNIPTLKQIEEIAKNMLGIQDQIPPIYSAKKINGTTAYKLARSGVDVQLKPKRIEIYDIKLIKKINDCTYEFEIKCSGGTYIRSIARDMGKLAGSCAYMSHLIRTNSGYFDIKNSVTIEDLKNHALEKLLTPIEDVFNYEHLNLSQQLSKNLLDGKVVKVGEKDGNYFVKCDKMLLGIGEVNSNILKLKTCLREDK